MNRDRFRFGFGGGRRGSDKLFTGQRQVAELGIYHYGARFYSPKLGRLLSADTIVPGYTNPQNLNRYSYVRNNPMKYIDPTGHGVDCGIGMDCVGEYTPPVISTGNNEPDDDGGRTTPTPTINPTQISLQTSIPGQIYLTAPATAAPTPEFILVHALSATPTATPNPTLIPNNDFPWEYTKPSILSLPDFAPNADDIWDIVGGALPLINQPATSLNQIVNNTVNTAINATRVISNTLSNAGSGVNQAIGNGLNYGPVMPIFIISSPYDLFPVSSPGPVYN